MKTSGRLQVACQILHLDRLDHGTLIDLVTLEPCERGDEPIPAGTTLSLGFDYEPLRDGQAELEAVVGRWERKGTVLEVKVHDAPTGICYQFSSGDNQLILLVEERA
ncbi:MAG: hypothetical protein ACRD2C_12970 [Acidimicrobiales bacterium]